jgi:hypothetical protein
MYSHSCIFICSLSSVVYHSLKDDLYGRERERERERDQYWDGEIWGEKRLKKKKQIMLLAGDEGEIWGEKIEKKKKQQIMLLTGDEGEIWGEKERYEGKKSKKIGKFYINAYVCIS